MTNNELDMLSLAEAARMLAVSTRTLRRRIARGDLRACRFVATTVIARAELHAAFGIPASTSTGPLLNIHEVSARLDCAPDVVRELSAAGELRMLEIGASKRWHPDDVDALAQRGGPHAEGK